MGVASCPNVLCERAVGVLLITCYWLLAAACAQLPPTLSLPAQISVAPPWRSIPLSQSDLGLLFSNSTPFTFSQSLLLEPPAGSASKAGVRASFGPYSITQLVSTPILPLSPPLTAALLSKTVERERKGERGEKFNVRVLFHWRGDSSRGSCVTLHAFKETQEQKATCITQPPLGLCVISLPLPKDWFTTEKSTLNQRQTHRLHYPHRHRNRHRGRRHWDIPVLLKSKSSHSADQIQLYYSSSGSVENLKLSPPSCAEDELQQSQKRLYHIGAVALEETDAKRNKSREEVGCSDGQEEDELRVDPNVVIGYRRGPVRAGQPIGVSVSVRSNFTGDFVVIRLKVKKGLVSLLAQPSLTSDFWAVTLERSTGTKHDIISIICLRAGSHSGTYSPTVLQQVACLSVDGLQKSFGVAMTVTATWWVEYSGRSNLLPPHGGVANTFSFTDRDIVGIAPITESNTIINTAILTSQPVSLPVIVLAVGHDGKVSDVTAAVTCRSTNEDIVKVSSDCSALFVDGSESGVGSTCVGVEFHLGKLSGDLCLSVWAPIVPLLISLSDPVLNAIEGWTYYTESGCSPVFQRSTVQVLAQFAAQPSAETGQLTYMLGSPDWFIDVTELVHDWLKVENPRVAALDKHNYLIGLQPGITSLQVISNQWDGVLGSCDVIVTTDHVTPGDLSVQVVGGLSLSVTANPAHPSVVTATVTAHNILYNHGQEASLSIWLQFSDDTASLVSAFNSLPFSVRLSSMAETVVAVTPAPSQRVVAQGDGGGPLVKAELLVSTCQPMSNSVERREPDGKEGGGTKRLAKGSGWVRVNLDLEFRPMGSEEQEMEMLEISEVFPESEKGLYNHYGDNDNLSNSSSDYDNNNIRLKNDLERAVLTPNHEGSGVYFSPGMERERGEGKSVERELEVGVGAVLSLLCLSMVLFLVNCLPCALRERGRRRRVTEGRSMEEEEREVEEERQREGDEEGEKGAVEKEQRGEAGEKLVN